MATLKKLKKLKLEAKALEAREEAILALEKRISLALIEAEENFSSLQIEFNEIGWSDNFIPNPLTIH